MRQIEAAQVTQAVKAAAIAANYVIGADLLAALARGAETEESPIGKEIFRQLLENARIAKEERIPLCQDCGLAVVFAEVGQDVHLVGGDFDQAINAGIRQGYGEGHLRKSLCHPLTRANTGDNTPAVIHTEIVRSRCGSPPGYCPRYWPGSGDGRGIFSGGPPHIPGGCRR